MLKNFKQLTFAISILACSVLSAQTDFTMYNMSFVPQSQFLNPEIGRASVGKECSS